MYVCNIIYIHIYIYMGVLKLMIPKSPWVHELSNDLDDLGVSMGIPNFRIIIFFVHHWGIPEEFSMSFIGLKTSKVGAVFPLQTLLLFYRFTLDQHILLPQCLRSMGEFSQVVLHKTTTLAHMIQDGCGLIDWAYMHKHTHIVWNMV